MPDEITLSNQSELAGRPSRPLDQNPALVFLAGKTPGTRRVYESDLDNIAEIIGFPDAVSTPWEALRAQHTMAIRAELVKRYEPAGARRMLSALRGVLKAAWRLGQMPTDDYMRAVDLDAVEGSTLPAGRALGSGEIAALIETCENDPTPAGPRDAAILALMAGCGLRRDEVVHLDLSDLDAESGALKVSGKGKKGRMVYLVNGALRAVRDWLELRGREPGPLFWPVNKGGRIVRQFDPETDEPQRMTNQAVYNLLEKRAAEAKVSAVTPHDLRRTYITALLDAGADVLTVARLAGHSRIETTQRYDRRPEIAKQEASGKIHIPYRGRMV